MLNERRGRKQESEDVTGSLKTTVNVNISPPNQTDRNLHVRVHLYRIYYAICRFYAIYIYIKKMKQKNYNPLRVFAL